jgi:hypothetical protein
VVTPDFSSQVRDFDPGITPYPGGLFWTVPLRAADVLDVQFGAGTAELRMTDLPLKDYFTIPNALLRFKNPVSVPATCSFDIHWSGPVTSRGPVTSPKGSVGELVMSQATLTWSAQNAQGFRFQSDAAGTTSEFAQLGHVQNGVFASG